MLKNLAFINAKKLEDNFAEILKKIFGHFEIIFRINYWKFFRNFREISDFSEGASVKL